MVPLIHYFFIIVFIKILFLDMKIRFRLYSRIKNLRGWNRKYLISWIKNNKNETSCNQMGKKLISPLCRDVTSLSLCDHPPTGNDWDNTRQKVDR